MKATTMCPKCNMPLDYGGSYDFEYDYDTDNQAVHFAWWCVNCGLEGYDKYIVNQSVTTNN